MTAPPSPERLLQQAGIRATSQRLVVLEALMREHADATAQSLHERLLAEHPSIGLATVYRTLNTLAEAGLIDAMQHGSHVCYRFCSSGHHHHLVCRACHSVVELHECEVGEWVERQARAHGFHEVAHTLELVGLCGRCSSRVS